MTKNRCRQQATAQYAGQPADNMSFGGQPEQVKGGLTIEGAGPCRVNDCRSSHASLWRVDLRCREELSWHHMTMIHTPMYGMPILDVDKARQCS